MKPERRSRLTVRPNGSLWDEQVYRDYIGAIDRRDRPVRVARLSDTDAFSQSVAAESRERDAA